MTILPLFICIFLLFFFALFGNVVCFKNYIKSCDFKGICGSKTAVTRNLLTSLFVLLPFKRHYCFILLVNKFILIYPLIQSHSTMRLHQNIVYVSLLQLVDHFIIRFAEDAFHCIGTIVGLILFKVESAAGDFS